jgi:beta-glucanase (GH16 family)
MLAAIALAGSLLWTSPTPIQTLTSDPQPAAPAFSTTSARNEALILRIKSPTAGATIHYTTDGTTPTASAEIYQAPFLVASNVTVKAIAVMGDRSSPENSITLTPNIPSGTLVWSEEFNNATGANVAPDPNIWTYDTGNGGFGNRELETYCAWGSNVAPCSSANPSLYVGTDGSLHIVARQAAPGVYTSARLKSQGLFSFQYGRIEFRARVPEAQGFWPAAWLLGNNMATVDWPACGEMDVLERVNAAVTPDWNEGSIHGPGFIGGKLGTVFKFPAGQTASQWHTYGMIWKKGSVAYYVDDPGNPYVVYSPANLAGLVDARWPFDDGQPSFIVLNLAIGGSWPGPPDASTRFSSEMLVDYVRIYSN